MELYKKYRPKKLVDLVGQPAASKKLLSLFESKRGLPHTILFTGPSGCGKTTTARILKRMLKCGKADITETNGASFNGVKDARLIEQRMHGSPVSGDCRIWIIDECHRITGAAWDILLKPLEDTPDHVYFFLCTSEPQKIKKTVQTRCTQITMNNIPKKDLHGLVTTVAKNEKAKVHKTVMDKLLEIADGSARQALVLLQGVINIKDKEEQIEVLESADTKSHAEFIARLLLDGSGKSWTKLKKVLAEMKQRKDDPEALRYMVLGYVTAVALKNDKLAPRCHVIFESFCENFYDSKIYGLIFACYEVFQQD